MTYHSNIIATRATKLIRCYAS